MAAADELAKAQESLAGGLAGAALRAAWDAAFAAEFARDAAALGEVQALAARIEEQASGGEREEAHRLGVFCAACSEDIRAGIPHDSAMGRLFRT